MFGLERLFCIHYGDMRCMKQVPLENETYKNLRILVIFAKSLMHFFSSDVSQSLGGGHYHSSCARLLHGLPGIRCMFGAFTGGEL